MTCATTRYNYVIELAVEKDGTADAREVQCSYTDHCRGDEGESDVRRRAVADAKNSMEGKGFRVRYAWVELKESCPCS